MHGEIKTYISYVRLGSTFSNDPIKSNKVHRLNRHRQLSACLGFMLPAFMFDVLSQRLSESVSQMEFYLLCLRNIKYLDINPRWFDKTRIICQNVPVYHHYFVFYLF